MISPANCAARGRHRARLPRRRGNGSGLRCAAGRRAPGPLVAARAATSVYAIWGGLLGRYPAVAVAPLALLSPVTGVVASALVFGERFMPLRCAGMALILAGLAVVVLPAGNGPW